MKKLKNLISGFSLLFIPVSFGCYSALQITCQLSNIGKRMKKLITLGFISIFFCGCGHSIDFIKSEQNYLEGTIAIVPGVPDYIDFQLSEEGCKKEDIIRYDTDISIGIAVKLDSIFRNNTLSGNVVQYYLTEKPVKPDVYPYNLFSFEYVESNGGFLMHTQEMFDVTDSVVCTWKYSIKEFYGRNFLKWPVLKEYHVMNFGDLKSKADYAIVLWTRYNFNPSISMIVGIYNVKNGELLAIHAYNSIETAKIAFSGGRHFTQEFVAEIVAKLIYKDVSRLIVH